MKNELIKARTQKCKKLIASILCDLLFAYVAIFITGCDGPTQTSSDSLEASRPSPIQAKALQIIQNALVDKDPLARVNAIEVIVATGQTKFMPQVLRLLRDKFTPVRFAAALAIGDLRYSPGKDSVSQSLKDEDINVIVAAAYAMGRLGPTEYLEIVRKAIENNDQTVRANAALILGRMEDRNSLELLKRAQDDKNSSDKVRFQALEARAKLGDNEVLPRLWAIVYSAYADDRIMGIRAIGALGTSKTRDILITKLDDDILEVRLAAAEQLGKLGNKTGEREILEVFEKNSSTGLDREANERINVLAALAIGEICTPKLIKFLPNLLKNESKFVRIAAAKAVLQCKMK